MSTARVRTAVVTGAGSGIGRSIAERLARGGHRVVVNDIDRGAAEAVAADIGAMAMVCDASSEEGAASLYAGAREYLGDIDIWFANAGVDRGRGLDMAEDDWRTSIEVNVMANVRAARLLVPYWVERGHGRLVVTASAAGMLTFVGAPAYSVSKHAAIAFAEWLALTYRHRGIVVQALCPQGVRTDMLANSGMVDLLSHNDALEPAAVAELVWEALATDDFFILPHPEVATYATLRATEHERWLRGMNKLQQKLETQHGASA